MIDISDVDQGSIPAVSTNNIPSNIQHRPKDGVSFVLSHINYPLKFFTIR